MDQDGRSARARRQRKRRRQEILAAGMRVFAQEGYHAASVSHVVREAGVARGTFYLYFDSKRALLDEVLDALLRDVERTVRRVDLSPGAPPPMEQLRGNLVRLLDLPRSRPEVLQVLLWEAVGVDEDSDRKLGSFHQRMYALTRHSLDLGTSMGLVRPCDTEVASRFLVGTVKELLTSMVVRGELDDADTGRIADELLRFATHGILRLDGPGA